MITKQDLLEAIAECQGTRNPNANTAIKLAAFYTILDHLEEKQGDPPKYTFSGYSYSEPPDTAVQYNGESEFAKTINGKQQADVWAVMDELMSTIKVLNERLYNGVMRKLTAN